MGVLALAIVSLLGLLGPTLRSLNSVQSTDKALAAFTKLQTYLNTGGVTRYEEVYREVTPSPSSTNQGMWFIYYEYFAGSNNEMILSAFEPLPGSLPTSFEFRRSDNRIVGKVFRVRVVPSPVNENIWSDTTFSTTGDGLPFWGGFPATYESTDPPYLVLQVDVFEEDINIIENLDSLTYIDGIDQEARRILTLNAAINI